MRTTLKCLSALLSYPSAELQGAVGEIRRALAQDQALGRSALAALDRLLARIESQALLDLQADYTGLFDGSRALSLHLFEHVHGESRERGAALVALAQQYLAHGAYIADGEMPDFIPLFLEFLTFLDADEARERLGQPAHVLAVLEDRLRERGSPYAAVLGAMLELSRAKPNATAVAEVRARTAEDEALSPDDRWQEAPVTFSGAPAPHAQEITLSERIRAALAR
jgi:nitrate reductase delta subunit